jgi:hypothetical protein
VQTNEVRRCALLLPAVAEVAKSVQSGIALVDIGTSSGLNLLLDKYLYRYSDGTAVGTLDSHLKLSCTIQDSQLIIDQMPKIASRIGIDLNPIDLNDAEEMLWAISLLWPDQVDRVERLRSAAQILKSNSVELVKGDAISALPEVAKGISAELSLCIMHSFTLNQFSLEARENFEKMLCSISTEREVWRISLEWIGTESPQMNLDHYHSGKLLQKRLLANCHQHGEWIKWINHVID